MHLLESHSIYYDKSNGYYKIGVKGKTMYLHRYIIDAKKGEIVDHIDRNRNNNTRENLRIVSKNLNNYNRDTKNNIGRGIYFDKAGNRYRACISYNNKTLKLGSFKSVEDAKKAYNKKSIEIYGQNAYIHTL